MAAFRCMALLALAVMIAGASAQDQLCVLPAKVASSVAEVAGKVTSPVNALVRPNARSQFGGLINIVFPQGACPTPATLAQALPKAYLATPKGWNGLSVSPTSAAVLLPGNNMKLADLTVSAVTGNVLSKPGAAAPVVATTSGVVETASSFVSGIAPTPLAGRSMAIAGSGCKLSAAGATVTFSCPSVQVNDSIQTGAGAADLSIRGVLTAVGNLAQARLVPAGDVPKAP